MVEFIIVKITIRDEGDYSSAVHTVTNTDWQILPDDEFEILRKKIELYNHSGLSNDYHTYLTLIVKPDQTDIMTTLDKVWESWHEAERKKKEREEARKAAREQVDKKKKAEKLRKQLEQLEKDIT